MSDEVPAELYSPAFHFGSTPQPLAGLADWFNGLAFKNIDFSPDGLPVVKIAEIKGGISDSTKRTKADYDPRVKLTNGDLLFCWSGQPETSIGTFIWSQGEAWLNQHIFRIVAKEGVDPRFLHFLLLYLQPNFQAIAANKQTTGLGHVTKRDLQDIAVQLPELGDQQKIAEALQPIQERLALADAMAKTLEATACALFQSWFIDFDPVHAGAGGYNSLLPANVAALFPDSFDDGGLPTGWSTGSPADLAEVNPTTPIKRATLVPYVDMAALPLSGPRIRSQTRRPAGSGARFRNGDTLIARITPCLENGKAAFVDCLQPEEVAWGSTEFIVLRPKPGIPAPLPYLISRNEAFRSHMVAAMSGTSGRQRVQADAVARWAFAIAPRSILTAFGDTVNPIFHAITKLAEQSDALLELRNALLAPLVSGELLISEGIVKVEAA